MKIRKQEVKIILVVLGITQLLLIATIAFTFINQASSYQSIIDNRDEQIERLQGDVQVLKVDEAEIETQIDELSNIWSTYKSVKGSYEKSSKLVSCPRCGMTVRVSE